MKAMVLAAGLGTRMAPLARACAKPALPVLDVPVILRLVRQLAAGGVERAIVNVHAHPESLRTALRDSPIPIDWVQEPVPRGSGGGILGARELLGDEPFLVVNGDMCLELDVAAFAAEHRRCGTLVTLALRDDARKREFGSIGYDRNGHVCRITERIDLGGEKACGLFIGVQLMSAAIFARMPARAAFEIIPDVFVPALRDGERIATWLQPSAAAWAPVGTPAELLDANLAALRGVQVDPSARVEGELAGPVWVGARARIAQGARVGPAAVVSADAEVGGGAVLERSLALTGARVAPRASLDRAVAFGDEVWRDG